MKYRYWFMLFSLLVYQLAFSQENSAPVVENVIFEQRTDGSYLVDVYYDVYDADGDYLTINMRVSDDGGETWDFPCDEVRAMWATV